MLRDCLMARLRRRWWRVHTPVKRRGTILPRSATKPCSRRTSRYEIASIFSVQNLHTFLRRKNLRPPGPPAGAPAGRGVRGPAPGPEWPPLGRDAGACCSVECVLLISSAMIFPSQHVVPSPRSRPALGSLNIRQASVERKRSAAIVMRYTTRTSPRRRSLKKLNRRSDSLGGRMFGRSCCSRLLLIVSLRGGSVARRRLVRLCARLRAALDLGIANRLNLRQTLFFFVHAHRDELDHLLRHTQTALKLHDQRALRSNDHQNVKPIVKLAHSVGKPASAHLLDTLYLAGAIGDVSGKAFNQLVEVSFFNVRPDDEHNFVGTIHSITSFCEVLLRTVLTSVPPTRSGKSTA